MPRITAAPIHDLHLRRELIALGEDVVNDAFRQDLDDPAREQIERAEKKLFDLATTGQTEGGFRAFGTALTSAIINAEAAFKRSGKTVGVATGFVDLDSKLGGLHPSDLVILAGRPSMGKTALATNIAFYAARNLPARGCPDGRAKLPRTGRSSASFRSKCRRSSSPPAFWPRNSGVSSDRIRRGDVSHEDFDKFVQASQQLAALKLFIDDTPALSVAALRTRARRLKRQQGLGLIVVDYLQLLRPSNQIRGSGKPRSGDLRNHARAEGPGQRARCSGAGIVAALARRRAA